MRNVHPLGHRLTLGRRALTPPMSRPQQTQEVNP